MILLRKYRESFTLPPTEPKKEWDITWDVNGWGRAKDSYGPTFTMKDWNQTIMTKINQLSAEINIKSNGGGANVLECGTNLEYIFNDLEYYHHNEKSIGGRIDVIFKRELQSTIKLYNRHRTDLIMTLKVIGVPEEYYDDKRRRLLLIK